MAKYTQKGMLKRDAESLFFDGGKILLFSLAGVLFLKIAGFGAGRFLSSPKGGVLISGVFGILGIGACFYSIIIMFPLIFDMFGKSENGKLPRVIETKPGKAVMVLIMIFCLWFMLSSIF